MEDTEVRHEYNILSSDNILQVTMEEEEDTDLQETHGETEVEVIRTEGINEGEVDDVSDDDHMNTVQCECLLKYLFQVNFLIFLK